MSGSYVVLARKWRSQQFSDVVGQGPIIRTLSNAIRSNRVHQAYLFAGSRGIGKTTIARIFAKTVRCKNRIENNELLESCDQCSNCTEILKGNSVDVVEIDGASNNGVDAIREIRENAKYQPASGHFKIYIIDEVHMLTTAAFNALLKTLEEPPAHVIFIFATTESHKIPATILSRCQKFDFKRFTVTQILSRLEYIAQAEKIESENGALSLIARAAEGGMRDALSLLDQVIAFSGNEISNNAVRTSIGLLPSETVLEIIKGILTRDVHKALQYSEEAFQQGHDLKVLTRSLIEYLHSALLLKVEAPLSSTTNLLENEKEELKSFLNYRSLEELDLIFQVLHHGMDWIVRSPQPKAVLDVLLIKCAKAEALVKLEDIETLKNSTSQPSSSPKPNSKPTSSAKPASWTDFIEHVRNSRPLLASLLEYVSEFTLPTSQSRHFNIFFQPEFAFKFEQLNSKTYQEQLKSLAEEYFKNKVIMKCEIKETKGVSVASKKAQKKEAEENKIKNTIKNHPILQEASALFGTKLGPIELKRKQNDLQ